MNRTYSFWEWTRAYLVLVCWLPLFPVLMRMDGGSDAARSSRNKHNFNQE